MTSTAEAIEGTTTHGPSTTTAPKGSGGQANYGGRRGGTSLERVTVNLTRRASDALEQLDRLTGESKTDSINKALQLFAYLQQVQQNNGAIYVREPGSKELEKLKLF
jgi:hypothetical protein